MSWEAAGAIGEIVGAVAVIATIFYLARQIKDGATQIRVSSLRELNTIYNDAFLPIYNSRETMSIWVNGLESPETLTEVDRQIFFLFVMRLIASFETIVVQHGEGTIQDVYLEQYRNMLKTIVHTPGGRAWLASGQMRLSDGARALLDLDPRAGAEPVAGPAPRTGP